MRQVAGWGNEIPVDTIRYNQKITDYDLSGDMYRMNIKKVNRDSEYFFVTAQMKVSSWDDKEPGKGLLIWHIHDNADSLPPHWGNGGTERNTWEMHKWTDLECGDGLWDTTGAGSPSSPDPVRGRDNLDFYALRDTYTVTHRGNLADSGDLWPGTTGKTIFDGLSNPRSNSYRSNHESQFGEPLWPQDVVTHLAVYNIRQDPSDTTAMRADLLVNNWYGHLPHGKTIWGDQANLADRHYVLTGDLTIDEGDTLVIRPATRVDVYPNTDNQQGGWYYDKTEIIVKGTLIVEQEDLPPVQFSSNGEYPGAGDWVGIRAEGDQASVQLAYCTIKDAVQGVCFALGGEGSVTSCTIENMSTSGIEVYSGSNPLISGNTIHDFGYYGIYVLGGNSRITQNQVTTDRFGDVAYGLVATEGYSGEVDQNVFAFTGWQMWNWSQWGMYLSAVSSEAYFHHNQVYGFGQGGVYVEYSSPYFWCENVHDNMYNGLYCYYYANPTVRHGRYKNHYNGVYATGYSWPNLSAPDTLEGNSFLGYDYHAVNANPGLFALTAENCYWDSVPPNPGKFSGWVDYDPYLNSEPPACSPPGDGGPQDKGGIQLQLPKVYALGPAIPNPSNGQMRIIYQLPKESVVNFRIYNVMGQLVRTLRSGKEKAGYYSATWDGKDAQGKKAGAGVYFYRLDAGEFSKTKKLVIVR
jgi:parallel beta-helix repeat protein